VSHAENVPPETGDSPIDTPVPPRMGDGEVDHLLHGLAVAVDELRADADAAERRHEELFQATERLIEEANRSGQHSMANTRLACASRRQTMALDVARACRGAVGDFAAWWADLSTLALVSAATGDPVDPVRATAGNPQFPTTDRAALARLPGPPDHVRQLAELAAIMAGAPGADATDGALAHDFAADHGLAFRRGSDGAIKVIDDIWPDARRRRIWADDWTIDRTPTLPPPDQLAHLLGSRDVPPALVSSICRAREAVADAVEAKRRAGQLESSEGEDVPDAVIEAQINALYDEAETLTTRLAEYARTITAGLATVRAARRVRTAPFPATLPPGEVT
jgi:hypothetical protein